MVPKAASIVLVGLLFASTYAMRLQDETSPMHYDDLHSSLSSSGLHTVGVRQFPEVFRSRTRPGQIIRCGIVNGELVFADQEKSRFAPSLGQADLAIKGDVLVLGGWYGRAGNNIIQIVNAILFGQITGMRVLRLPPKPKLAPLFDIPAELTIPPRSNLTMDCECLKQKWGFFGRCLQLSKKIFQSTLQQNLVPLMNKQTRDTCERERTAPASHSLTVHLRSGDALNHTRKAFAFAPCAFLDVVIKNHSFRQVRIITEHDMAHPCIKLSPQRHPDVTFTIQIGQFVEDFCALMHARNFAVGSWSTFSQTLELFNDHLETVFVPVAPSMPLDRERCLPPMKGGATTFNYEVSGLDEARSSEDKHTYITRTTTKAVRLRSKCNQEEEIPFLHI